MAGTVYFFHIYLLLNDKQLIYFEPTIICGFSKSNDNHSVSKQCMRLCDDMLLQLFCHVCFIFYFPYSNGIRLITINTKHFSILIFFCLSFFFFKYLNVLLHQLQSCTNQFYQVQIHFLHVVVLFVFVIVP